MPRWNTAVASGAAVALLASTSALAQAPPARPRAAVPAKAPNADEIVTLQTQITEFQKRLGVVEAADKAIHNQVAAAKTKADAAKAKAEAADAKATAAQGTVDQVKSGKLVSSGVTGGVAFAVQAMGPFNNAAAKQTSAKGVVMPYILALPAYWGSPQATREACASSWNGGDDETIDSAARAVTRKRAARIFDVIEARLDVRRDTPAADVVTELQLDYGDNNVSLNMEIVEAVRKYSLMKAEAAKAEAAKTEAAKTEAVKAPDDSTATAGAAEDYKKRILEWMAGLEFRTSRNARCWTKRFGLWIGIPLSYDATTTVPSGASGDKQPTASRTVKPVIAFGGAFSPNAYVSLLVGLTVGSVTRDDKDDKTPIDRTIWATTVAVGGNLDVVTSLTKGN